MKRRLGSGSAGALVSLILVVRMYTGMLIDFPSAANATWMCPILGMVFFLPFQFSLQWVGSMRHRRKWDGFNAGLPKTLKVVIPMLFSALLVYDAAIQMRLMASSYNVMALNNVTVHLLIFPLAITALISAKLGTEALGNSARIALRFLCAAALLLIIVQLKQLKLAYLTPLFGTGFEAIFAGGIYCAGCMALFSLIWLQSKFDEKGRGFFLYTASAVLATSILLALHTAGYSSMPFAQFTRAARIELVMSNGRMSLAPQFLLNILWYGGLLYLICAEVSAAVDWVFEINASLSDWLITSIAAASAAAIAIWNPAWLRNTVPVVLTFYPIVGAAFVLALTFVLFSGRKLEHG